MFVHASIQPIFPNCMDYQLVTNVNTFETSTSKTAPVLTIATRESRLALWQAEHVKTLLAQRGHRVALLGMTTRGDQILDRSLSKVGGKGLFVKELEVALEEGRADLAVHSLKDVPMDLPLGFALACVMEREDPRDALVSNHHASLAELPIGSVVGTSSLRRMVLLRALRPDLKIEPLRGNLDTRLRKLDDGHFAAIVLAAAGVYRLNLDLSDFVEVEFSVKEFIPAPAQGVLALQIREADSALKEVLSSINHTDVAEEIGVEREVMRLLQGGCQLPLGVFCKREGDLLKVYTSFSASALEIPLSINSSTCFLYSSLNLT